MAKARIVPDQESMIESLYHMIVIDYDGTSTKELSIAYKIHLSIKPFHQSNAYQLRPLRVYLGK